MLSIRLGLVLTTVLSFLPIFVLLYTNAPVTIVLPLWISFSACASLSISVGLAFISLTFLFSRGGTRLCAITCGMMGYALVMGVFLNPFKFGDIELSVIIFGTIASIEIALVLTRGLTLLEDMRRALYPDAMDL